MKLDALSELAIPASTKIVLLFSDALPACGLHDEVDALAAADLPALDALACRGMCGLHRTSAPSEHPGEVARALALLGYDAERYPVNEELAPAVRVPLFAAGEKPIPPLPQLFWLRAAAVARAAPVRRAMALAGVRLLGVPGTWDAAIATLTAAWSRFDLFVVQASESGDALGALDRAVARLRRLGPDVVVVTGSGDGTPAGLVPLLLWSAAGPPDAARSFVAEQCWRGGLGAGVTSDSILPMALAHAGRLRPSGAAVRRQGLLADEAPAQPRPSYRADS